MWINPTDQSLFRTHDEIRAAWPGTSFPADISPDNISELGLLPVKPSSRPAYTVTQTVDESFSLIAGVWTQLWSIRFLMPEELRSKVPTAVTPRQAYLALLQADLLDTVEDWVATQSRTIQIDWAKATEIRRDWPPIANCATALGLNDEQLDALFLTAVNL